MFSATLISSLSLALLASVAQAQVPQYCLFQDVISLEVQERPIVINEFFDSNTVLAIPGGIRITIDNAPTLLNITTVAQTTYVTTTQLTTATVTQLTTLGQ